jgi:hypothetical protein
VLGVRDEGLAKPKKGGSPVYPQCGGRSPQVFWFGDRHPYEGQHTDSTRYSAATALLDRGYGRLAQCLDLHLSADAITKRLSDMTDAELAALEQRMIAAAPIVLEATANVVDDAGEPDVRIPRRIPLPDWLVILSNNNGDAPRFRAMALASAAVPNWSAVREWL